METTQTLGSGLSFEEVWAITQGNALALEELRKIQAEAVQRQAETAQRQAEAAQRQAETIKMIEETIKQYQYAETRKIVEEITKRMKEPGKRFGDYQPF